jgi:hypothetical protein
VDDEWITGVAAVRAGRRGLGHTLPAIMEIVRCKSHLI